MGKLGGGGETGATLPLEPEFDLRSLKKLVTWDFAWEGWDTFEVLSSSTTFLEDECREDLEASLGALVEVRGAFTSSGLREDEE